MPKNLILYLRSLIFLCIQAISTVPFALGGIMLAPFPYIVRYRFITLWSHFIIWSAKAICGIQYEVRGLEHLPAHNAICLCNHQSAWETLFLQTLLPPQTWVLKKQLLQIPFFGWGLSLLEPIAIDRKKSQSIKQLLTQGTSRLKKGRWVVIFPEGKRMKAGHTGKHSRSGAVLAKETGYKIVPIAHNAGICWPRQAFVKHPGKIIVVIGEPIDPAHHSVEEAHKIAQEWINDTVKSLSY